VTRFEASSHDRIVHRCEQCNVTIELANSGDEKKPGQMWVLTSIQPTNKPRSGT